METLTEMFDRIIKNIWNNGATPDPIGIATNVGRMESFTDVKPLIRSQTDVKRRAFDKGALARGGVIEP